MPRCWPVEAAWEAVTAVIAAIYGVEAELLRAESRGRGPRPPERAREPKKVAIFLTVVLSGVDYAGLARRLGLHKDTVASHCAEMRDRAADSDVLEQQLDAMSAAVVVKLALAASSDWSRCSRPCEARRIAA